MAHGELTPGPWTLDASLPLEDQITEVASRLAMVEAELAQASEKVDSLVEAQKTLVGVVMDLVGRSNG